jgi:hypothetical protein
MKWTLILWRHYFTHSKTGKGYNKRELLSSFLINIETKVVNKLPANQIQQNTRDHTTWSSWFHCRVATMFQ